MNSTRVSVSVFHRAAVRVAVRGALSVSAVLGLGLGITTLPSPASASTAPAHPDFDPDALFLSTTTDTLPEDAATRFEAMAGDPVHRVYYLHNRGLLPLDDVTVFDPGTNGAAIHCGSSGTSDIALLLPRAWATCSATFTAAPGEHHSTATASGAVILLHVTLTDEAQTGYTAVVPAISASLTLGGGQSAMNLPAGTNVPATVTVHNPGSVTLTQAVPTPQPPLSISSCGSGGPVVHELNPGGSANCTATLVPALGEHVSSVTVTGTWRWDHPITEQGPQSPQDLSIQTVAEAGYTGVPVNSPPPPPTSPPPSSPAPPPPTPRPWQSSPAAVPPQSPQPTPSSSLSPGASPSRGAQPPHRPGPTPTPNPTQAAELLQQPVSQFRSSRGLSLPLKVLVIIIIPAVAAAAGARRAASSRR